MLSKHMIFEGIDNVGKSTVIKRILDRVGYHPVIHFDKPVFLERYAEFGDKALKHYQTHSFECLLKMMSELTCRCIFDRSHIGEMVYAKYRKYDGSYVYELEEKFLGMGSSFCLNSRIVLLYTSNFDLLQDDGECFNFAAKEQEQEEFFKAVNRSRINLKQAVDIHDGNGNRKPVDTIIDEIFSVIT